MLNGGLSLDTGATHPAVKMLLVLVVQMIVADVKLGLGTVICNILFCCCAGAVLLVLGLLIGDAGAQNLPQAAEAEGTPGCTVQSA